MILRNDLDWGSFRDSTLSISMLYEFFTYFLMVCKSRVLATLLVVITNPLFSIQMKLAMTSNLMFFSALLMLVTWVLESFMKLLVLVVKIKDCGLSFSLFSFLILFFLIYFFIFSIFRTLGLGVEVISHIWWCGHSISHGT